MAQSLRNDLRVNALSKQKRGHRVAEVIQPDNGYLGIEWPVLRVLLRNRFVCLSYDGFEVYVSTIQRLYSVLRGTELEESAELEANRIAC